MVASEAAMLEAAMSETAMFGAAMSEAAMSEAMPETAVETTGEMVMINPMVVVKAPIGQIDTTITRVIKVPAIMDELIRRTRRSDHRTETFP